ncbi:MAG: permease-like cell division protein FtsX [Patescibacteria group bacterium]|nr:permease-like cell division protein FtsX [Patescibacteria group bacterium]
MISFFRIIKFALQGVFRNFWLSVVTITMMIMAVLSVTILVAMDYVKEATIASVKNKVDILVELRFNAGSDEVEGLVIELERLTEVKSVRVITPQENLEIFRQRNQDSQISRALDIYDEEENPFSYSLAIGAYDLSQYPQILEFLNQEKYSGLVQVSEFDSHEEFIERINSIAEFVNRYSLYLALIFIAISVIVIFNTIRISIYTRRDEIMIMKLVGAGNSFVRLPFVLESVFYALAAVLLVAAAVYPLVSLLQPVLNNYFQDYSAIDLRNYFIGNLLEIFFYQFIALALINTLSTSVAIRRYLRI